MSTYTVENFTSDITVEGYIAEFRDEPHFLELCKQCTNYGKSWGCPPFDFDTESFLRQYKYAHLMATKIIPEDKDIPIEYTQKLILPERIRIESELLDMERKYGGRSFAYIGKCLHSAPITSVRVTAAHHADTRIKVRPSLEAFGFDIAKTLAELFNIELLWGKDGKLPEYLVLVSGFFHNEYELCNIAY